MNTTVLATLGLSCKLSEFSSAICDSISSNFCKNHIHVLTVYFVTPITNNPSYQLCSEILRVLSLFKSEIKLILGTNKMYDVTSLARSFSQCISYISLLLVYAKLLVYDPFRRTEMCAWLSFIALGMHELQCASSRW